MPHTVNTEEERYSPLFPTHIKVGLSQVSPMLGSFLFSLANNIERERRKTERKNGKI